MRGFGAFGMVLQANLRNYTPVPIPASVAAYMGGKFTAIPGRTTLGWSVKWPGYDSSTKQEVADYEASMANTITAAIMAYKNFKPGDPTYKDANKIEQDIRRFADYNQIKIQDLDGLVTMAAMSKFYETYFGDYETWRQVTTWLGEQSRIAGDEMMATANLLIADLNMQTASAKHQFYKNKVIPLGSKFTKSEQQKIRDVFIMKMDGAVSLDELIDVIKLLSKYLSLADLTAVMQFGYQMVLGNDLASNVLNTESDLPYGARNVEAEVNEIRGKYNAVASRLGRWLDPETNSLLEDRLNIHRAGYAYPNDPKYYVCGAVCNKIMENIMGAVTKGLTSAMSVATTPSDSAAIYDRASKAIQDAIASGASPEEAAEIGRKVGEQISAEQKSKGGVGFLLLGGAALLYFMKGKK